jgi:hypothetical protein
LADDDSWRVARKWRGVADLRLRPVALLLPVQVFDSGRNNFGIKLRAIIGSALAVMQVAIDPDKGGLWCISRLIPSPAPGRRKASGSSRSGNENKHPYLQVYFEKFKNVNACITKVSVLFIGYLLNFQQIFWKEQMAQDNTSGGVNISGGQVTATNIAGRDIHIHTQISQSDLSQVFRPVAEVIERSAQNGPVAMEKLELLKLEARKGKEGDHSRMTQLIDAILGLVPEAFKSLAAAFAAPVLSGVAGPVTQFLLAKITGQ